jgi:hypothetical protein
MNLDRETLPLPALEDWKATHTEAVVGDKLKGYV